jgi:hypothetical protein
VPIFTTSAYRNLCGGRWEEYGTGKRAFHIKFFNQVAENIDPADSFIVSRDG